MGQPVTDAPASGSQRSDEKARELASSAQDGPSRIKLLHTADWQLGLRAAHLRERSSSMRDERLHAARRCLQVAANTDCQAVLIAGDLFDRPDVDSSLVTATVELLDDFSPLPILILPGNHDPLAEGAVWERQEWARVGAHVQVLRQARELDLADFLEIPRGRAALYPCPIEQKQSRLDPTAWIPARDPHDGRLRIGLAHGSLEVGSHAVNFPIASDRAKLVGLDYLALGDWHGFSNFERTAYPGTIEQCSFSEQGAGYALVVELEAGRSPRVERHRTGRLTWAERQVDVAHRADLEALRQDVTSLASPGDLVMRLRLQVARADLDLIQACEELVEAWASEIFFLDAAVEVLELDSVELESGLLAALDESLALLERGGAESTPESSAERHESDATDALPEDLEELRTYSVETVREARLLLRRWAAGAQGEGEGASP